MSDLIKGTLLGILFTTAFFLAMNLVNDHEVNVTVTAFNCIPDNESSEARVTLVDGKPFCTKHERLTDAEQRAYLNKIWPLISAEWNSKR